VHGWVQFSKDLEAYTPPEVAEKPVAEVIMGLPAVSIQATGMITESNLPKFKLAAETFIANIKTELVTDEDFVNAEANVKFCKTAEDDLEGTKKAILAQTTTIDEAIKVIDYIKGQLAGKRLMLDKLVKSEKEARKLAIILQAKDDFNTHVTALHDEIKVVNLIVQMPDFAGVMKGLKKLSAMQEAVDTALRNGKFEADTAAKDVRAKLAWCKENAAGHSALFPDLQNLMSKPMEDFALTITSRIEKHRAEVAENTARIQAAAVAQAERAATEKMAAEEARIRAEERAKAESAIDKLAEIKLSEVKKEIDASSVVKQSLTTEPLQIEPLHIKPLLGMDEYEFLVAVKDYIETAEWRMESEFGHCRSLEQLIQDGDMPPIYAEVIKKIDLQNV
jgi:hypothetical protein